MWGVSRVFFPRIPFFNSLIPTFIYLMAALNYWMVQLLYVLASRSWVGNDDGAWNWNCGKSEIAQKSEINANLRRSEGKNGGSWKSKFQLTPCWKVITFQQSFPLHLLWQSFIPTNVSAQHPLSRATPRTTDPFYSNECLCSCAALLLLKLNKY